MYKKYIICSLFIFIAVICKAQYNGTGSVTQGLATTTQTNIYNCSGGRVTNLGTITATDNTIWTVPANTNFTNSSIPFSSDLYNSCNGNTYPNTSTALAALNGNNIVTVDADGEIITAYIFADNYFEMYINGINVGKDKVPYTQFNSSIIRFKVKKPFTIVMHLVDWEENLGLGSELSGNFAYHNGDGGVVAIFKDASNTIIAKTDTTWKAQTFYTAPITDLTCPTENGTLRLSYNCNTADTTNGSNYYALHWIKPANCFSNNFNDASWPNASVYSNATVGVNNKPAFTNFTDIFDDVNNDASFIWSTNIILDNEVVVRKTVSIPNSIQITNMKDNGIIIYPNPVTDVLNIRLKGDLQENEINEISIYNLQGQKLYSINKFTQHISLKNLAIGNYVLKVQIGRNSFSKMINKN